MTGDVEGYVHADPALGGGGLRGVEVTLHSLDGKQIAVTRSEFDGYYAFNGIPVGGYQIRVTQPSGAQITQTQEFSLDPDQGYILLDKVYIYQ